MQIAYAVTLCEYVSKFAIAVCHPVLSSFGRELVALVFGLMPSTW